MNALTKSLELTQVKKTFELLLMSLGVKCCTVPELAKELGVKKTTLMQFVLDNQDCFVTRTARKVKQITQISNILGVEIKDKFYTPISGTEYILIQEIICKKNRERVTSNGLKDLMA